MRCRLRPREPVCRFRRGGDRIAHADTHDAPGADVDALARLIHVDDAAREIERVGALVDEDRVGTLLDDGAQNTQARRGNPSVTLLFIRRGAILATLSSRLVCDGLGQSAGACSPAAPMPCEQEP
jgi:hypothetical protein